MFSAISQYWMRIVIIPAGVLKKITSICRSYLWEGKPSGKKNLVAWKSVCKEIKEGGLGIKCLGHLNIAMNLSQVWNICLNKDNIWTRWLHSYFIQNRNFWNIQEKIHFSWQLKRLLKLREKALLCVSIGEDSSISWNSSRNQFSVSGTYKLLKGDNMKPPWTTLVWSKFSAPKHSLCIWMAIQNKLLTRDRINWIQAEEKGCSWCQAHDETNHHIFFMCPNMQVLKPILQKMNRPFFGDSWDTVIEWRRRQVWTFKYEKE